MSNYELLSHASTRKTRLFLWLIFFVTFACGVFFRFYKLGLVPLAPYWDEVAMLVDARMLLETGRDLHGNPWAQAIFTSYGDYKLPVYIWATTVAAKIFGISALAVRIPSAIAGLSTIGIVLGCTWMLCGQLAPRMSRLLRITAAFAAAGFASLTPWSIHFSRTGFEAHLSQALAGASVLVLLTVLSYTKNKLVQSIGVSFASLLASFSIYTYFSTRFIVPIVLIATIWLVIFKHGQSLYRKTIWSAALTIVCGVTIYLSLIPMFRSPLYEISTQYRLSTKSLLDIQPFVLQSNRWRELSGDTLLDRIIFHRRVLQAFAIGNQVAKHVSPDYLFVSGDSNLRHGTSKHGVLLLSSAPFLLLGLTWLVRRHFSLAGFLSLWWFLALIPASIPTEVPHALRSLNALVPIMILTGIGFAVCVEYVLRIRTDISKYVIIVGICLVPLLESGRFMQYYFRIYPTVSAPSWQHGYQRLAEIAYGWSTSHFVEIDSAEYRLLLWLFAFTSYPAEAIQTAVKEQGSFPTQLTHIRVRELEPERVQFSQLPKLVIGTQATMQLFQDFAIWQPRSIIRIDTMNPDTSYAALEYVQQ